MDLRQQDLREWLVTDCQFTDYTLEALPADASFRRYFRVWHSGKSYVAMDAPPQAETTTSQFIKIAQALRIQGLHAPQVIANDLARGFLLLTDLGDKLYLKELNIENASVLYTPAMNALAVLQACKSVHDYTLPQFSADFMVKELQLMKEWFLQKHLGLSLSTTTENMLADYFYFLAQTAAEQPQVFMHRDYHSANLTVLPQSQVGILDFQDAFVGPVTYDLVSLLRDCYIAWPETLVTQWVLQYKEKIVVAEQVSATEFLRWFDLMGMQRHLKTLMTFSRKYHRDGNANYLQHIPRTLNYIVNATACHSECRPFNEFLNAAVMPALEKVDVTCAQ